MCENCNNDSQAEPIEVKKINAVKFLRESGLFFQINRDILHPLGLAMEATLSEREKADGAGTIINLWDCREDPEGIVYDEETVVRNEAKLAKFMSEFGTYRLASRSMLLGYITQYSNKSMEEFEFPMDFGKALHAAKAGHKILRRGWNGTDMCIVYQKGYPNGIPINKNTAEATGLPEGTECQFLPYLMLKTKGNQFVPWAPNMIDILADDWTYTLKEREE